MVNKNRFMNYPYDLVEITGKTKLIITIENFNNDASRIENIAKAWGNIVIPAIEKLFN